MPIARINADEYACDGCEKKVLVSRDPSMTDTQKTQLPAGWLTGVTTLDFEEFDWVAHGLPCVKNAISAAYDLRLGERDNGMSSGAQE